MRQAAYMVACRQLLVSRDAFRVTAPPDDLSLEVKDVRPVRLPVSARIARKLIGVARPAPIAVSPKRTCEPVTPTPRWYR